MKYKEYKIYCEQDKLETLEAQLAALGIEEIIINDPADAELFSPEKAIGWFWNAVDESVLAQFRERPSVCFYLEAENSEDPSDPREERGASGIARERLSADQLKRRDWGLAQLLKSYEASVSTVDDQDWLHKWEEYYVPSKISEHFVVKPDWKEYDPAPGEQVISIDPGLAFGTGTSATTYLVVRLMEKWMRPGDDVLDVGCGTGILSIVASKLGAKDIMAVDIDPEAIDSTKRNAAINGCEGRIKVVHGDLTKGLSYRADVVVANLISDLVVMLSPDVAAHCKGRGLYISSGIIDGTEDRCRKAVEDAGFEIIDQLHDDCWTAFAAVLRK
ncbi:MAG: 50S ribosomal protein L11 methyltransferase [Firmicutes bacterium]|nr:50S ribosomal protein L11 methyltransferase [Bacillota bacterium]